MKQGHENAWRDILNRIKRAASAGGRTCRVATLSVRPQQNRPEGL
ncbi:hypothetical protein D559_3124 [Bordetella holmesii 1058]|nr:hypothetical protein D555_1211 [Bordetella holmesii 35009]EXX95686.1 hypothetical protein D559_3124 [Bordetella holmesii 1058]KAK75994.1 hypothetical protein L573_0219 [Bordetella holmesii H620]KAK83267.1 hypothetical protein L503_2864 [Bordetella holmesii CDC-H809-BH]KCV04715.1 hypothetical protein L501_2860 [Bordetella holmesii CDC-H719-BH]KCV09551.1 hypothetical protein AZ25_0235 [Bordetella holmesii 04P3421]